MVIYIWCPLPPKSPLGNLIHLIYIRGENDHSTSKLVSIAKCSGFKNLARLHMLDMAAAIQIYSEDRPL